MIVKGSSRAGSAIDVRRLSSHLLARENSVAEVVEIRGVAADTLGDALAQMREVSLGGKSRRPLYHASINVSADEADTAMTAERWSEAVNELERHLGLVGHQRAVVRHVKKGRTHYHVVWNRVDVSTLRAVHDGQSYARHECCARLLEARWNLRPVVGVHSRPPGAPRPVSRMTDADRQAADRTGTPVADVAATLSAVWASTATGQEFAAAIAANGLCLASGRRGIVVVDMSTGTPHSLPRRLGFRAADVQQRLADIDTATLPTVDQVKSGLRQRRPTGREEMPTTYGAAARRPRRRDQKTIPPLPMAYWEGLGFTVQRLTASYLIKLSPVTQLEDCGDRLLLHRNDGGQPTDEEIRQLVTACKEHMSGPGGWEAIRFFGGTPEFQRRCRAEAMKQGIGADLIRLECEETLRPLAAAPMPDHVRRRLHPDSAPGPSPLANDMPPSTPTPAQEVHP